MVWGPGLTGQCTTGVGPASTPSMYPSPYGLGLTVMKRWVSSVVAGGGAAPRGRTRWGRRTGGVFAGVGTRTVSSMRTVSTTGAAARWAGPAPDSGWPALPRPSARYPPTAAATTTPSPMATPRRDCRWGGGAGATGRRGFVAGRGGGGAPVISVGAWTGGGRRGRGARPPLGGGGTRWSGPPAG